MTQENFSKRELKNKDYVKPKGEDKEVPLFGELKDGVRAEGDIVLMDGFKTFVCPIIRNERTYNPSRHFFAVGDPRPFHAGDRVLVDCIGGKSAVRRIRKVSNNILELKDPLTHPPLMAGDVFKVIGVSQDIIREVRS